MPLLNEPEPDGILPAEQVFLDAGAPLAEPERRETCHSFRLPAPGLLESLLWMVATIGVQIGGAIAAMMAIIVGSLILDGAAGGAVRDPFSAVRVAEQN